MNRSFILIGLVVLVVSISIFLGLATSPQSLVQQLSYWLDLTSDLVSYYPVTTALITFAVFTAFSAVNFPGMITCTIIVGLLFGSWQAILITAFGGTLGNLISFLVTRNLFRQSFEQRWATALKRFNDGLKGNEFTYLMAVRLLPVAPYYLINVCAALSRTVEPRVFVITSFFGTLPKNYIFASAGAQIRSVETLQDVFTTPFYLLMAIGLLPLAIRLAARRLAIRDLTF